MLIFVTIIRNKTYKIILFYFVHTYTKVIKYNIKYEYEQVASAILQNNIDAKNFD